MQVAVSGRYRRRHEKGFRAPSLTCLFPSARFGVTELNDTMIIITQYPKTSKTKLTELTFTSIIDEYEGN